MFRTKAIIHSLAKMDEKAAFDEVLILHESGSNDVVAEYNGIRYTAIFNPFICHYYVDDIYGKLTNQYKCSICGAPLVRNPQRMVWEGWTVQCFIDALSDEIRMIMTNQSWRKPFETKEEMVAYIVDNQPYYKKAIAEVNEYFINLYGM